MYATRIFVQSKQSISIIDYHLHLHRMQCHKLCVLITIIFMGRSSSALNCSDDKPFDCGNVGYITYPFWGGDRPSECGRKGFELICNNNIPTLTISSLSYLVQKLDFSTNTLTVARQDLHDTTCPDPPLHNTTVDWKLFKQPSAATDRNITLFFDCAGSSSDDPNAFACSSNNRSNNNLFTVGGGKRSCSSNIYVPINNNDAESLENPTPSSINILRSALATGFSIQWFNDSKQFSTPFCNPNVYLSCRALDPTRPVCDKEKYSECYTYRSSANDGAPNSPPAPAPAPAPAPDGYPPRTHKETPTTAHPPQTHKETPTTAHPPQTHYTSQFDNTGAKRTKKIVIVVVSVSLSVAGIVAVSISLHCFLKRRRHSICGPDPTPLCKHDVEKLLLQQGSRTPKRYKYSQLKKITASFRDKLGQGGFGSVYKGMLSDGRPVAVKILIEAANSNGEEFLNEIVSISRTSHVNIVTLLGFCYEGNKRALVYEYMPNNSLDKFLKNNRSAGSMDSCCLDIEKLYKIALGIAKGLEYLHTGCITRIVHFDIKPQNILLDEDLCPKISDFGLAKLCKKKQSIMSVLGTRGTVGYIAPEVFSRNFGGVSHKSDVYSYGMMLLEMAGATKLPEADEVQSNENYFPDIIYEQVIRDVANKEPDDLMMEEDEETTTRKMILVGFWCIQTIPSNRPSISKVVEMIEGRAESIQIPPKPLLSSPPHLPSSTHQISSSLTPSVLTQDSVQF